MTERFPTTTEGAVLILRREVQMLLHDSQTVTMTLVFAIGMPIMFALLAASGARRGGFSFTLLMQLMIFPHFAGLQAAHTAFVAEKEQGTLGPLLATPLSNGAIFYGKVLSSWLPGVVLSLGGFGIFRTATALRAVDPLEGVPLRFVVELIMLATVAGLAMVAGAIMIGAKARSLRGAQTWSSLVLLPVMVVVMTAATLIRTHEALASLILAGLVAASLIFLRIAARLWRREEALVAR